MSPSLWIVIQSISLIIIVLITIGCLIVFSRSRVFEYLFEKRKKLEEDIERNKANIGDQEQKIQSHNAEMAKWNAELAEKQVIIEKYEKSVKWLEDNKDTVSKLETDIKICEEKKDNLIESIAECKKLQTEEQESLKKIIKEKKETESENSKLIIDNDALKEEIKRLEDEQRKADTCLDEQKSQIAENERTVERLNADKAMLEDELEPLRKSVNDEKNQLHEIKEQNDDLRRENESLIAHIDQRKQEKEKLTEEVDELKGERDHIKSEIDNISNQLDFHTVELRNAEKDADGKKQEVGLLNQQILKLKNEVAKLKGECIENTPVESKSKWDDLDRKYLSDFSIRVENADSKREEHEWIEEFKNKLKDNHIIFHDRMLNAFHTGLKVADASPLVVLAGISGTGKSLLPRLYAKALGMNFLQLAVQPRWDNPQDMFGFYNYMERRYKATELSRLLWQFDIYNNEEAKKQYKQDFLPMNLILLDEMNIAKVEYYFSDMLSKLEACRGITETDEDSRRNAEIEIESGAVLKDGKPRRLYIGRNTLFVGTMNEDESTQSLSDKVIDRSNVLRFGKPNNIKVTPEIQRFEQAYSDVEYIDFATWKRWHRHEENGTGKNQSIDDDITKINDALVELGRPFGYRTSAAIKSYANNYPGTYKEALADQIEMKILPKLNGINKENIGKDKFKQLQEIIEELKDKELAETFSAVLEDQNDIFFSWHGVSR